MKKMRWGSGVLAAALMLAALLTACGGPRDAASAFGDLLAKDYEVCYIFYSQGLPVDDSPEAALERDGSVYRPSASEEYKTMSDLEKLLEETYAGRDTIEGYLALEDSQGHPLFLEEGGKLYQSAQGELRMPRFEARDDTAVLVEETEERAVFTLEEDSLDGSLYQCTLALTKTEKGWRLETPREEGERTLLREGSDEETLAVEGSARAAAEAFLEALKAADTGKIEMLTEAPEGTYSGWRAIQIENAQITDTQEEGDSYGSYRVALKVLSGAGIFADGESTYKMEVGFGSSPDGVVVRSFRPAEPVPYSQLPYEERTDGACEAVMEMIGLFGFQPFGSPAELPAEVVTEYCLSQLSKDKTFEEVMEGISPQELSDAAWTYFGLEDFQARDTAYYNAGLEAYMTAGRSGFEGDYLVMGSREGSGGTIIVEVRTYTDPLQTQNERIYIYTMSPDEEEGFRFLSAAAE